MLIAHVEFHVAAVDRDGALALLIDEAAAVRAMPGNLKFQSFANPEQDGVIEILHEWDGKEAFDAYIASELFKSVGQALGPKMTAPPLSKRFTANPIAD